MKKKLSSFFSIVFLLLLLAGCGLNEDSGKDVFQYKGTLVGDNSSVGAIIKEIPFNEYFKEFSLQTKKEPYGIIVKYDIDQESPELNDENMKELALCNSTYLFALVQNAEWVQYEFGTQTLKVKKKDLQAWYDKDLSSINDEKDLKKLLQDYLSDKNEINRYFEK
nr:DUF4825 domain-containing protein [uncultured Bacillus sp.]